MTPVPVHLTADGLDPPVLVSQSVAQNDWSAPGVPEQDLRQSFEFLKTEPRRETASSTAPTTGPANMTSQDAKKLRLEQLRNRLISVKTSPVKSFTTEIPATDLPTENLPDLFSGSQEARPQGSFVDLEPFKDGLHFMSRDELNRIWQDYVALSRHCGRGLDKLNPISFRTQLINNHRAISTTYKCSSIRFRVKLKNGKPSLSARPA